MKRPNLQELERICQKPDHRRLGNWMARRVSRPAALRVTWLVAPWGVSANAATLLAWAVGMAAAAAFAWATPGGWLLAAALLQLWYLLDHVDGQLARLHGTASLDGVELDYLMHHTINLLVPLGIGVGVFLQNSSPLWFLAGLIWGLASLLITLHHDARYKAFAKRLKRVHGRLHVQGGGGARPSCQPPMPRRPGRLAAYLARKVCETHVVMNLLTVVAVGQWLLSDTALWGARIYLGVMGPLSLAVAAWTILRSLHNQEAEREFAAWYGVPDGCELVFRDGWWYVEAVEDEAMEDVAHTGRKRPG